MTNIQNQISIFLIGLVCLLSSSHTCFADKTKQALKYLDRGELDKVEEVLTKSLEKEPLNPTANYLFSVLFSMEQYHSYNIDSAKNFVLLALSQLDEMDDKIAEDMIDAGIEKSDFEERKSFIEKLIFKRAVSTNSIEGFNEFMVENPQADQFERAKEKRDSLAFLNVKKVNSWKAYKSFMESYPNSIDFPKAKIRYDKLIFQSKTKTGKLNDLKQFLNDHPNSPYHEQIQHEVFSIIAADGSSHKILDFLKHNQYNSISRKAINILYHLDEKNGADIFNLNVQKTILDSLKNATMLDDEVLFPVLEDDRYLFINFSGEQIIKGQYDSIPNPYFCGNIVNDVLDVTENGQHKIINRTGSIIFSDHFNSVEEIEIGVLKVKIGKQYKVIHKSGYEISDEDYDDISVVGKKLIKVSKGKKVGLLGITGKSICPIEYDDIYTINDYWIFEKNGRIGLLPFEEIIKGADGNAIDPIMKYDEAELIDDEYLICFTEDKEVLFNKNFRRVVPEGVQRINTRFDTWTTKQPFGYRVFNKTTGELTETLYDDLIQNEEWLALKKNNKWSVYRKGLEDVPIIGLDSVKLIGEDIAMVFRELSGTAIFPNKTTVEFTTGDLLYPISNSSQSEAHYLVINKNGENTLYRDGEELFSVDYETIGYLNDSAFYVKTNEKYGAVNITGNLVMRVRYDAIIAAENNISPVLYNGKFGGFNFTDNILLKLDYDQKMRHYNQDLLIVTLDGKEGLLNKINDDVMLPQFDKIEFWSDSIALTKTGKIWSFTEIYSGEEIYSGILDYTVINKKEKNTTLRIRTEEGYGIYDLNHGLTITPSYSDIININTLENPLYFCEKAVPEGNYYIAIYKDKSGKTIRSQAYRAEEYERIVCE